jgi:hypothetical protein
MAVRCAQVQMRLVGGIPHPQLTLHRIGLLQPDRTQQPQQAALFQPGLVQRGGQHSSIKRQLRPSAVLPGVAGGCGWGWGGHEAYLWKYGSGGGAVKGSGSTRESSINLFKKHSFIA